MNRLWKNVGALMAGAGLVAGCGAAQEQGEEARKPLVSATQGAALESVGGGDTITLTADNQYELYINGAYIGGDSDWYAAETHSAQVNATDVVAVKVVNTAGSTGLLADIKLDGRLALSTDRLAWKCTNVYTAGWEKRDFSDASWPAAVEYGSNGVYPWGSISGISAGAKWIGTSNSTEPVYYCRATVPGCGQDEARNKPATSSGYWDVFSPDKAFDGDPNTIWESNMSTGAWVQVDLGSEKLIGRAAINWNWDARFGTMATAVLEGSKDGSTWQTLLNLTHTAPENGVRQFFGIFPRASVRYVRFRATQLNGGWMHVADLQLYYPCTQCGEDQAYKRPASSNGSWSANTPDKAFDRDPSTGWESSMSTGAWVQTDLGQPINIDSVEVTWGWDANFGSSATSVVESSTDGQSWTLLGTLTHTAADNHQKQYLNFNTIGARYVRLRGAQWNGGWGDVLDLQVIGACETCANNLVLNKPVTASSYWSPYSPAYAVDGTTNRWGTGMSTGAWLQVDMGQVYPVGYATLWWDWDGNFGTSADTLLEGSVDGANWTPLGTFTQTKATNWRKQSLFFSPVSARYVRMRATRWNGGWGDVVEMQVCPLQ